MEKQEKLLCSFEFLKGDTRWAGAVDVVQRTVRYEDGNVRQYTDLRLRIGDGPKYTPLPRRGLDEILTAIEDAKEAADEQYDSKAVSQVTHQNQSNSLNRRKTVEPEYSFARPKRRSEEFDR